jgi:polyhydroxybutyrate depolymerase
MTTKTPRLAVIAALALLALTACTSTTNVGQGTSNPSDAASAANAKGTITIQDGQRPFTLHVPSTYTPGQPAALVVLLHGYTATGAGQEAYLKFTPESDKRGFLYAYPDGMVDPMHNHFWNATDACCDLYGSNVDDSTYLSDLIKKVESLYTVDTKRVYLIGHSNGAFMTFRMACDHADQITAIAALNGAMWSDLSKCKPSGPVSVLDIRSTADQTINYKGGSIVGHAYPSAATTNADWLRFDKCAAKPTAAPALDLVLDLPKAETSVNRYAGCAGGSTMETWTINNGGHIPDFGAAFAPDVMDYLLAQVKPTA